MSNFSQIEMLNSQVRQMEAELAKQEELLVLHAGYLEENRKNYDNCRLNHSKALCDVQIGVNVVAEEKKVKEAEDKIALLKGQIKGTKEAIRGIVIGLEGSDRVKAEEILEASESKFNAWAKYKTPAILISMIIAVGVIIYLLFRKK